MEWTGLNELREKYLSFFESKGHMRLPSFSLIPDGDKSLLLINAGMAPMKKYFTGEVTPPSKRVTTCQKCIRTPDIERVGKTARHGTYFEMLGNFSFGDYFKHEATAWAWEFCTDVLKMPADRLYCSVFEDDDEAVEIWTKEVGVAPDHIVRLGREDNFWEHGAGPCGPCSEIYFDRGEKYGCGSPDCKVGCDCDRFVEFWNLVFTQFENDGNNNYTRLSHPNIDTGMGLERLACITQGVDNLFLVDTVQNIMKHVIEIAGTEYGANDKTDVSLRVITDHIRSTVMMIGDGVLPSNVGRGYVLRRLLRRAARHGRLLGIEHPFLSEVASTVIRENESAYPVLREKEDYIVKVIAMEEESFLKTIDAGLSMLGDMIASTAGDVLSGADAFRLQDTYGFPIDLTREILSESGKTVDDEEFERLLAKAKATARAARKDAGADAWKGASASLADVCASVFTGYDGEKGTAKVTAAIVSGERAQSITADTPASLILDSTPFYAESGGQVCDTGTIEFKDAVFAVDGVTKTHDGVFIHSGMLTQGESISVGDTVLCSVDSYRRSAIKRNHTAAHLLQAALRKELGTHVEQAGQLVNDELVRFDFSHFAPLTYDEITRVEDDINAAVLASRPVVTEEMSIADAKKKGAMALFSEKYGDTVRVVSAGDTSVELCGGTHVSSTGEIGLFKIIAESSVAAGVRRIEGVTGFNTLRVLRDSNALAIRTAAALKAGNINEIDMKAHALSSALKECEKLCASLKAELSAAKAGDVLENAVDVDGIKLIVSSAGEADANALRSLCDAAKAAGESTVAVFGGTQSDRGTASIAAWCGELAIKRGAHAGNLVRALAQKADGNGGGKPDSAMAGCKSPEKLPDALGFAAEALKAMIK